MVIGIHCDAEGCDSWQRYESDMPVFWTLTAPDEEEAHFCSLDHVMQYAAANSEPNEIIR